MPKFLRIKSAGQEVVEVDITTIVGAEVLYQEEEGLYTLLLWCASGTVYCIKEGTADKCHFMLNRLHDLLDTKIIDL
jgi:hypothetical protein